MKTITASHVVKTAYRWEQPRGLGEGKSGWNIFQAVCEHQGVLREEIPKSIITNLALQDGLHFRSMGRRMAARDDLWYDCHESVDVAYDPYHPLRLHHWNFHARCVAHVVSSGLAKGMCEFSSKDILGESPP